MKFKKIYIEITNICNLNCDFCIKNKRKNKFIKEDEFEIILKKIKPYTNYIYMHVLGEPLMHPKINKLIDLAHNENFNINITTNGYLISRIKSNKNIRQLNISLHSYDEKYGIKLQEYLNNIFEVVDILSLNTFISYRLWVKNKYHDKIIEILNKKYNKNINKNMKLNNNVFINFEKDFIWPDLNNNYYNTKGTCYGGKDHIAILCDGSIIPCCLDSLADIKLGNIYEQEIEDILKTKRYINLINEFKNNNKIEELCKHCNFIQRKTD